MSKRVQLGPLATKKTPHSQLTESWTEGDCKFVGKLHVQGHDPVSGDPIDCRYVIMQTGGTKDRRATHRSRTYPYSEREIAKAEAIALFETSGRMAQPKLLVDLGAPNRKRGY